MGVQARRTNLQLVDFDSAAFLRRRRVSRNRADSGVSRTGHTGQLQIEVPAMLRGSTRLAGQASCRHACVDLNHALRAFHARAITRYLRGTICANVKQMLS